MKNWTGLLKNDTIAALLSSGNDAVIYFTERDLLGKPVGPLSSIWELPAAQKLLRKQQSDGSWIYPGKKKPVYPDYHYSLVETFKRFRILVERYRFTRAHPTIAAAAEFLFSCQSSVGDIRGMLANQYATYYTGAILALLINAGYQEDTRVVKGMRWLLSMRQDDGGWCIPILTGKFSREEGIFLTSRYAEPFEPDRSRPFSHNWTNMVLQAFAAHPVYRRSAEARAAALLMKSRFFRPDNYTSYQDRGYWVRFVHWWPNLLMALESLLIMGFPKDDPDISKALDWFIENQQADGLWNVSYKKGEKLRGTPKDIEERLWISLAVCRVLKGYFG
jgi:hypothetical protein